MEKLKLLGPSKAIPLPPLQYQARDGKVFTCLGEYRAHSLKLEILWSEAFRKDRSLTHTIKRFFTGEKVVYPY